MDRQSQPYRRRRPAKSCIECRRRKIKCDRNDPCAHCVSAEAKCAYKVFDKEPVVQDGPRNADSWGWTPTPSAHAPSPLSPVQAFGRSKPGVVSPDSVPRPPLVEAAARRAGTEIQAAVPPRVVDRDSVSLQTRTAIADHQEILKRIEKLEKSSQDSLAQGLTQSGQNILADLSGLQDSRIVLNKTRLLRWSHWMLTAPEFAAIGDCFSRHSQSGGGTTDNSSEQVEITALVTQTQELLHQCKDMARILKSSRPSRWLISPEVVFMPPSRDVADTMANLYISSFESALRILHIPTFWADYQRYWDQPGSVTTDTKLTIFLVIGIGSSLCEYADTDAEFRNMVHHWVYAAQAWLSGPLEKDRLTISGLQVHLLTILARQVFAIGGDLVWTSMGSLIHSAMQIGLHRDPKHLPAMSLLQSELRRRLWATVLEMAVQSSLDSTMPLRISFDEYDTEAPSNYNDDELDESHPAPGDQDGLEALIAQISRQRDGNDEQDGNDIGQGLPNNFRQPHPKSVYTTSSTQLLLLDSLPIRIRILQLLNSLHSEISYSDVLALSSEITDVHHTCVTFMNEHKDHGVTAFHRNLLDYLVRRFFIPLHCPFISKAKTNPLFQYSRKVGLDVAMALIFPEPDEGFSHLLVIGGGMFREASRYAWCIITVELVGLVETQALDGTLHRNTQYREHLKQVVKDGRELSAERLRRGETNIKMHMFLNTIIAQVEAMESNASRGLSMARGSRDSVAFCHEILKKRTETVSLSTPNDTVSAAASPWDDGLGYGFDMDWASFMPDTGFP